MNIKMRLWCEIHGHYHGPPYCPAQEVLTITSGDFSSASFLISDPPKEEQDIPDRIPLEEVYMRMAEELAKRSTCSRLQVGCVLTDTNMRSVLAVGYNGNCHGFPNECDHPDRPGGCQDIHAESNALVKAPGSVGKIAFITDSPCTMCGKLLVQANVQKVYYRREYRLPAGLNVLERAGIPAIHYNQWEDEWRN